MSLKGQAMDPPVRSDLSDPFRNNSFKSLKTSQYESKIYELSIQVKMLREKLIEMEQSKHSQPSSYPPLAERNAQLEKYVALLREDNDALRKQNLLLRDRLKSLEGLMGKRKNYQNNQNRDKIELASVQSLRSVQHSPRGKASGLQPNLITNKNSIRLSSGTSVTTNLMRQLLAECNEPNECLGTRGQRVNQKDEFYQFKNTQDCFEPFFSALSREVKIRLKRCLIKQKDLLLVDNNIEVGVISPHKVSQQDPAEFTRVVLVLTNIGLYSITNVSLDYVYSNDVNLTSKGGGKYRTCFSEEIRNNQQIKEELDVTVNNIDFKCIKLTLAYEIGSEKHSHLLILPLSKAKLFRGLPFTSTPNNSQRVQRVFQYERKILNELGKLKSFFTQVYQSKQKNGSLRYSWKVQFMGRMFWIEAHQVEQKLALSVTYETERALAQKILGQLVFLFQKL